MEDVANLVGGDAIDCGFAHYRATFYDRESIVMCAREASAGTKPFMFGYKGAGDDSLFCHAAVRDPDGQYWRLFYDFDVTGAGTIDGRNSRLWISRCEELHFQQGSIFVGSILYLDVCTQAPEIVDRLVRSRSR